MEEHLIRSIVTIIVLFITEANSLISTHKRIFIKKWLPLIRKKAHCYQNIFIVYLEPVLIVINWNLKIWSLKSP